MFINSCGRHCCWVQDRPTFIFEAHQVSELKLSGVKYAEMAVRNDEVASHEHLSSTLRSM